MSASDRNRVMHRIWPVVLSLLVFSPTFGQDYTARVLRLRETAYYRTRIAMEVGSDAQRIQRDWHVEGMSVPPEWCAEGGRNFRWETASRMLSTASMTGVQLLREEVVLSEAPFVPPCRYTVTWMLKINIMGTEVKDDQLVMREVRLPSAIEAPSVQDLPTASVPKTAVVESSPVPAAHAEESAEIAQSMIPVISNDVPLPRPKPHVRGIRR
jgi:hypothetical protein